MRKALYVIITCIFIMSFAMCGTLQISAAGKTKNTTGNKTKSETTSTQKDKETEKPEIDLSGMSYEELVELKDQISLAMWDCEEWQEVTVPQGTWVIGEDIPAGHWTIKCDDVNRNDRLLGSCHLEWGYLNKYGEIQLGAGFPFGHARLWNPNSKYCESGADTEMDIYLEEGLAIIIDNLSAPAVFCPYSGKESLGFK